MARLTKQARRDQLLDVALGIVRVRGTNGLTLVTLAEAAGVSRPIVYDHFRTRMGLLVDLYRHLDNTYRAAITDAVAAADLTIEATAIVTSQAYFACATDHPEFAFISAALLGDHEAEQLHHEMLESYAALLAKAIAPYSGLTPKALRLRSLGILAAADAIAGELTHQRTTRREAVTALAAFIEGAAR